MILLDTNVLSELAKPKPDAAVLRWAAKVPVDRLCTTAITEAELRFGLTLMSPGKRHAGLAAAIESWTPPKTSRRERVGLIHSSRGGAE